MSCPCRQCQGLGPVETGFEFPENIEDFECSICGVPFAPQAEVDGEVTSVEDGVPCWELWHVVCEQRRKS